jgi:hypothetical protein
MQYHGILLNTTNPFWDTNIMDLIDGIKSALPDQSLAAIAKELAAVFSLIYLSLKAYAMIVGEGKFEIMPLFRPFVITMVIINFSLFTSIVGYPASAAGTQTRATFEGNALQMDADLDTKTTLTDTLFSRLIQNTNELKKLYYNDDNESVGDQMDNVLSLGTKDLTANMMAYITVYEQLLWVKLSLWLQGFIMWIVLGIFKGICYCLFFLQLILLYVLTCIGPLSLAFSIAGPFKDAWVQWVARYIGVSFYSTIGFIILNIAVAIMDYGLQQEIDRLTQVLAVKDIQDQFLATVQHVDNFIGYLFIALVTAVAGIISTPIIATWIVQTAGAGNAFFGTYVQTVKGAGAAVAK